MCDYLPSVEKLSLHFEGGYQSFTLEEIRVRAILNRTNMANTTTSLAKVFSSRTSRLYR